MMVLIHPIATEKAIALIEKENKMVFIVEKNSTKKEIADEVEKSYGVKVEKVNVLVTADGRKKAYVKLQKGFSADELAAKLKII
ncbi:MAG: LSU ribosomal protein L23 [Candidatus Fermentimicrarchaeum limneticum]|uniref:Large ribosomal subunit protein uL23 n=1 Tax=Fermentimicrarchaeum limneticum TaxID=2795018 RepID=A0A7D5XF71_FERL1|nr:MAG: LSU ribosomal protein L23 [Candidatus Fermentimicrarchaeum limneticum]